MTGCGSHTETDFQPLIEENGTEDTSKDGDNLHAFDEEKEQNNFQVEVSKVNPIQLYKDYIAFEEWGDRGVVCSSKRDIIRIFDDELEKYPKLNNALENISDKTVEQMTLFMGDNVEYALEEEKNEYFGGYKDESKLYVQRADDVIVSIRENQYQYTGGAHPMSIFTGINIDPVTGETLTVSDVFTDSTILIEVLSEKLIEKYGEDLFYTSPEELLNEYTPEQFSWTVGYQGITFYFSPYELAPYAAGAQYVTIWFEEAKEWIDEKYMSAPKDGYVAELPFNEEVHLDLNAETPEKDVLTVGKNFVEETVEVFQMAVSINDETYFSEEIFYYGDLQTSLACVPDQGRNRYYLYAEYTIEGTDLYVYELTENGIKLQGTLENVRMPGIVLEQWDSYHQTQMYMEQILTDPSEFIMTSRMYLMGFMDGMKTYRVDPKDGMPKADVDFYILPEDFEVLTLKRDLEIEILPENKTEMIKEGTKFTYLRTDNETYMDFRMDDGRECRVYFEEKDWEKAINGFLPEECFDGIPNV